MWYSVSGLSVVAYADTGRDGGSPLLNADVPYLLWVEAWKTLLAVWLMWELAVGYCCLYKALQIEHFKCLECIVSSPLANAYR